MTAARRAGVRERRCTATANTFIRLTFIPQTFLATNIMNIIIAKKHSEPVSHILLYYFHKAKKTYKLQGLNANFKDTHTSP
jgi:hypothetical protein